MAIAGVAAFVASRPLYAFVAASVGGHPGEVDISSHFIAELGKVEPTERPSSWQKANIKILNFGAGYTIGDLGPLKDFYVRIEGGYYNAAEETTARLTDEAERANPAIGRQKFFDADRGGFVTATVATNVVHEPRFTLGLFVQGTVPIDVAFEKFSNVHIHYAGGGTTVGVYLTPPTKVVRLAYGSRIFVGSGAYTAEAQHNAAIALTNLFALEAGRWILPWKAGLSVGPYFEGDLNEHTNPEYNAAYAEPGDGDRVRAMRFAVAVLPYFRITDHAAVELGYVQKLFGYDPPATQFWSAGMRAQF